MMSSYDNTLYNIIKVCIKGIDNEIFLLEKYIKKIDKNVSETRPSIRTIYQSALKKSKIVLSELVKYKGNNIFLILNKLEKAQALINTIFVVILDFSILSKSSIHMSQTYVENLSIQQHQLQDIQRHTYEIFKQIELILPQCCETLLSNTPKSLYMDFYKYNSPLVCKLYMLVLTKWESEGKAVQQYIEHLKDKQYGLTEDVQNNINQSILSRQHLHPLQQMGITFSLQVGSTINNPIDSIVIDMTLPNTTTKITYNLTQLLTIQGFNSKIGINHHLIQSLNTIKQEPIKYSHKIIPQISQPLVPIQICRTMDQGLTYNQLTPPNLNNIILYKNIGAGPRLRLTHQSTIIEKNLQQSSDTIIQLPHQEAAHLTKIDSFYELTNLLKQKFTIEYDLHTPVTAIKFSNMIIGPHSGSLYCTYIAKTIAEIFTLDTTRRLLRSEITPKEPIFGPTKYGPPARRQEMYLTNYINIVTSTVALQRRLRETYDMTNTHIQAHNIFINKESSAAFKKKQAIKLFATLVDKAFAPSIRVEKGQSVERQQNIKQSLLCQE